MFRYGGMKMPYDTLINDIKKLLEASYKELSAYIDFLSYKFSSASTQKKPKKSIRKIGGLKGSLKYMADDFDAPLDDFKEYM